MEWTDDMTVRLGHGTSVPALVSYLKVAHDKGTPRRDVLAALTERFALPFDDARLAMGRYSAGITRAQSGNPTNEPDAARDPIAWTSYQRELGIPVAEEDLGPTEDEQASAGALLERARRGEPTRGTEDVAVALEVARLAAASEEADRVRFYLLLEAATSLSVAAEASIARIQQRQWSSAPAGSQEWVDGVALAESARRLTATFAAQPDPELEERGLALVGRIVTMLLGQCHAFVGRATVESAQCIRRNGDPERAATHVEAVLADFAILLDRFQVDDPFDEHVIALEHLLSAIDLIVEVRGNSKELDTFRRRTTEALGRSLPNGP